MANIEELQRGNWKIRILHKSRLKNPVLIEGLPGIANVGKIAVDFTIENKKAKKLFEFFSYDLPHSVFVQEDNLIDYPKMEIYLLKTKKNDLLLLSGDVQPIDERSCHEFCDILLDFLIEQGCQEVVTTGGIGLSQIPKSSQVFCTANDKAIVKKYKKGTKLNDKSYGIVGPVVGVTGVLLGHAKRKNLPAIALLAETFSHPMYLGMKGAKGILELLDKQFGLKLNLKHLSEEISELEDELIMKTKELQRIMQSKKEQKQISYIG